MGYRNVRQAKSYKNRIGLLVEDFFFERRKNIVDLFPEEHSSIEFFDRQHGKLREAVRSLGVLLEDFHAQYFSLIRQAQRLERFRKEEEARLKADAKE